MKCFYRKESRARKLLTKEEDCSRQGCIPYRDREGHADDLIFLWGMERVLEAVTDQKITN